MADLVAINPPKSTQGYLDVSKHNSNIQKDYFQVAGFTQNTKYENYFYASKSLDFLQCGFECQNVEVQCDLYFHRVRCVILEYNCVQKISGGLKNVQILNFRVLLLGYSFNIVTF